MAIFSERLRTLRNNFGLSQQKLADKVGTVSKSSINMYERGDREPGLETMEAFADFFNVDIDYLYGKSDIPNRSREENSIHLPSESFILSPHEKAVVIAYRSHPEMQAAIDRLLDITAEELEFSQRNA